MKKFKKIISFFIPLLIFICCTTDKYSLGYGTVYTSDPVNVIDSVCAANKISARCLNWNSMTYREYINSNYIHVMTHTALYHMDNDSVLIITKKKYKDNGKYKYQLNWRIEKENGIGY